MAKRKRSTRSKKAHPTSTSLRVDTSLLLAVRDELNELADLLRCLPELTILSVSIRARQRGQTTTDHDRIATVAMEHFGRNLDVIDQQERDKDPLFYDARFGIDPPIYAGDLIGTPDAVTDAVRWRLQRLRAVLEMLSLSALAT